VGAAPLWLTRDLAARDGRLDAVVVREPKARHGRREVRRLWVLADPAVNAYAGSSGEHGVAWPHLRQVCRVERERVFVRRGRVVGVEVEVSYAITSAPPERADAATLLRGLRGHWGIENRSHWVRDVTFDEDRCRVRKGTGAHVMASLRNVAISLLRLAGAANIAQALRRCAWNRRSALRLIGLAVA